jgi:exonuclease III
MVKGLTDCFAATATGPGWSYNKNHMYVRIDNIFCSDDFVPYGCKVDKTIKSSDHYPIYTWLKKKH